MGRDHPGPLGWTAREEPNDFFGQRVREGFVLDRSVFGFAQAASGPRLFVHQTGSFGLGQCLFLDENPLALVATPRATEPHHDGGKSTRLLRSPGECRVTGGLEDELVEIRTHETQGSVALHEQQVAGAGAFRADPLLEC